MKAFIAPLLLAISSLIGSWSAYQALLAHFGKEGSELCEVGASFSCDVVNQSIYADIFGIPFALLGLIGYGGLLLITMALFVHRNTQERHMLFMMLCGLATLGFGVQVYLTVIEFAIIQILCTMCLISQVCITIAMISAWVWRHQETLV